MVGAILALMLVGEGSHTAAAAPEMWSFDLWATLTAVGAGALLWTVYDRCDAWVTAFVVMAMAGTLSLGGAADMGGALIGGGEDMAASAVAWIMDGLWVGVGALVATKVPDML